MPATGSDEMLRLLWKQNVTRHHLEPTLAALFGLLPGSKRVADGLTFGSAAVVCRTCVWRALASPPVPIIRETTSRGRLV